MTFLSEELLAAVARDDKNLVFIWDISKGDKGDLLFKGNGGISHVFLIRSFHGWRDSGGVEGDFAQTFVFEKNLFIDFML